MRRRRLWPAATLGGFIFLVRTAHAETSGPELMPRLTLIELDYPQGVAASAGGWVLRAAGGGAELGLVGDVELGLSGPKVAVGVMWRVSSGVVGSSTIPSAGCGIGLP